MKKSNKLTQRKKLSRIYFISLGVLFALFVATLIWHANKQEQWKFWALAGMLVLFLIGTIVYVILDYIFLIRELIEEYRQNNNLLSGGMGLFMAFSIPIAIIISVSIIPNFPEYLKNIFTGLSELFIVAMPALIGLLGVQHSIAIQERNRKEDLRVGTKPFLSVTCSEIMIFPEKEGVHRMRVRMEIKNISSNIALLTKIASIDNENSEYVFTYHPLASGESFIGIVELESPKFDKNVANAVISYTDIYQNKYLLTIEILPQCISSMAEVKMISDMLENE